MRLTTLILLQGLTLAGLAQNTDTLLLCLADSMKAPAGNYQQSGFWRKLLTGSNYRQSWAKEPGLPVFCLSGSAFRLKRFGGSKETISIYLQDSRGQQWVLRSVDKDVKKGVPPLLRLTPFLNYKQELTSANHPYAALLVAHLVKAAALAGPAPLLGFLAPDSSLGPKAHQLSSKMFMLEKTDLAPKGKAAFTTDSMMKILNNDAAARVDAKEYLKARIIDMLVGDWDRHEGNWLWWMSDSGGKKIFHPIPRDRDHALFFTNGLITEMMKWTLQPQLVGFSKNLKRLKALNKKVIDLDKTFLSSLSAEAWQETAKEMQLILSDQVLHQAVYSLPEVIDATEKEKIKAKLINRRNQLPPALQAYRRAIPGNKTLQLASNQ